MLGLLAQMMDRGDMSAGWGWGWLIGLVLVVALVALVVVVVMRVGSAESHSPVPPAPPDTPRRSAEDLLAERLARGEIAVDEYRERLAALRGG